MKKGSAKKCARNVKICKYAFFNNLKSAPGILRFVTLLFLIFEKGMSKKTAPGFLRIGSILFLIFEKGMRKKIAPGMFKFVSTLF